MPSMREQCGTLKNHWYVACQSQNLLADKPLSTMILETRLVLYRTSDGGVAVLRDRCAHRNQRLSLGQLDNDCLRCPYHGWTFDRSGECVNVPSEACDGKAFRHHGVEAFPVREQDGLVWVWMGGPDCLPNHEPMVMPYLGKAGWDNFCQETDFATDVTQCVENYMDVPHTVWVHPGWFRRRQGIKVSCTVERTRDGVFVTHHPSSDSLGFADRLINPRKDRPPLALKHTDSFFMPGNTQVDYIWGDNAKGFSMISLTTPVTPALSKTYTVYSYRCGPLNLALKYLLPLYTRHVITQDVEMLNSQGASIRDGGPQFKHTPVDAQHVFIESLREWAEGGEQGEPPVPMVREVEFWI